MSGYSDFKVTGDKADLESFRRECERDERDFIDSFYDDDEDDEDE